MSLFFHLFRTKWIQNHRGPAMTTRKLATVALTFSVFNNLPKRVQSNGYMLEPPSRSYIASTEDLTWPECVSSGVCGLDALIKFYDSDWTDHKRRSPVPFASQRTYLPGNTIEVRSRLTNQHKAGHVELRGCTDGQDSVQECFERFKFEFVDDAAFGMPQGKIVL